MHLAYNDSLSIARCDAIAADKRVLDIHAGYKACLVLVYFMTFVTPRTTGLLRFPALRLARHEATEIVASDPWLT